MWLTLTFKVKFNFKSQFSPFWVFEFVRAINHHWLKSGFPNLDQRWILALLRSLFILGLIDLDIQFHFWFQTSYFFQTLCLLFICVVLYLFREAIASECSKSHMALCIYRFLCMRTWSRNGPRNSLPLYLGETIGVQPASTRQLALDFTSCYRFSSYYILFACRNCICQH